MFVLNFVLILNKQTLNLTMDLKFNEQQEDEQLLEKKLSSIKAILVGKFGSAFELITKKYPEATLSSFDRSTIAFRLHRFRSLFLNHKIQSWDSENLNFEFIKDFCDRKKTSKNLIYKFFWRFVRYVIPFFKSFEWFIHWSSDLEDGLPSAMACFMWIFGHDSSVHIKTNTLTVDYIKPVLKVLLPNFENEKDREKILRHCINATSCTSYKNWILHLQKIDQNHRFFVTEDQFVVCQSVFIKLLQ